MTRETAPRAAMAAVKARSPKSAQGKNANQLSLVWTAFTAMPGILELSREAAGAGLVALIALPVLALWISRRTLIIADPIVVVGMMWILAASLPALAPELYKDPIWLRISAESWDTATLWMYRAWAVCSLVYWAIKCLPERQPRTQSASFYAHADQLRVGLGVLGLGASAAYVVMTGGQAYSHIEGFASTTTIDQIVYELRQLSKIYIFLYFFARGRARLLPREHWLLYGILAVNLIIFGASASKGVAIELIAMWVLGNGVGGQRGNIARELALGAIALILTYWIFLWVTAYRVELQTLESQPAASFSEAIDRQLAAAEFAFHKVAKGQPIGSIDNPYDVKSIFDRLGYVSSFATMLDVTGGVSPYENAFESFLAPLYALLPRNMFSEKAQFFDSGKFAQLLGWKFGGFSVTLPASLFWAWGFEGLVPAMAALGLSLAVLARRAERGDAAGLFAKVMLTSLVLSLLNVGIHFQPIIISLVRVTIFLLILDTIVWLLFSRRRRGPFTGRAQR